MFLSRTLSEPRIQVLDIPDVADGIAYMHGLMHWIQQGGKTTETVQGGERLTIYRR